MERDVEVRQTSIEAYHKIKEHLSPARWKVYDCLYHYGPMTANEVNEHLKHPNEVAPSYHKRLSELEVRGLAVAGKERRCKVTGQNCLVWDVTNLSAQMDLVKRETKLEAERRRAKGYKDLLLTMATWLHEQENVDNPKLLAHRIRVRVKEIEAN